jgi:hypothetical protein
MPPVGFELTISAGERPQTDTLDRAASGTGVINAIVCIIINNYFNQQIAIQWIKIIHGI